MSAVAVHVDPTLVAGVRRYGTLDANACLQCGSCTIVCDLSTDPASFPRKSIRHVLLGMRETLLASLEPWLCHDCGDCSTTCPRQAEPRESMMTIRRWLTAQYDWTGLASRVLRSRAWYVGAMSAVVALVLALIVLYHSYVVRMPLSDFTSTSMGLEHMFGRIRYFTIAVFLIPAVFTLTHALRMYWLTMHRSGNGLFTRPRPYVGHLKTLIVQALTQKKMGKCPQPYLRVRWTLHWLLASGVVLICLIKLFFLRWFQTDAIHPVYHPQRWLGYYAFLVIAVASVNILVGRIRKSSEVHRISEFPDYVMPVLLLMTALTGIVTHIARYAGGALAAHYAYAIHLIVASPMLVIEMPFGKWGHMIYRPMALFFQAVRERAEAEDAAAAREAGHAA